MQREDFYIYAFLALLGGPWVVIFGYRAPFIFYYFFGGAAVIYLLMSLIPMLYDFFSTDPYKVVELPSGEWRAEIREKKKTR